MITPRTRQQRADIGRIQSLQKEKATATPANVRMMIGIWKRMPETTASQRVNKHEAAMSLRAIIAKMPETQPYLEAFRA